MGKHNILISKLLIRKIAREGVEFRCYPSTTTTEPRFNWPQGAPHFMMMKERQSESFAAETAGRSSSTATSPKANVAA